MPFRDREWENMQRDCSFFPAYTDYLFGLDVRPQVAEEPGLHPRLYIPQFEPIRYTNSMPSRSVLYNGAPDVPYHMVATSARTMDADPAITSDPDSGRLAVNLRSDPLVHHASVATSPEVVAPVPQNASRVTPTILSAEQVASSAETTRRRLLEASQRQRSPATSATLSSQRFVRNLRQQGESNGSPEQRGFSGRQAHHPSLAHSYFSTDVDGETGQTSTSITPLSSSSGSRVPPTEHAAQPQQPQQQHHGRLTNSIQSWQNPFVSSSGVNILRPGDLFADPRYLAAFRENLHGMDATIAQNWGILEHHPDETARKQALTRLQAASVRVDVLIQKWQLDTQMEAHASSRSSPHNSYEMRQASSHTQDSSESYMGQTMRQQHFPVQYQLPQQSFPPHLDSALSQGSQQPQHGLSLLGSPIEPMHHEQAMSAAEKTQHGLPESQPSTTHEDEQTLEEAQTPLRVRRWIKDVVEAGLPNYLAARRILSMPPNNPGIIAEQDRARTILANFRSKLGPDGQQYLVAIIAKIDANRIAASQHPQLKVPTGQQSKNPFIKPEPATNAQQSSQPYIKREQMSPAQQPQPVLQLQPPQQPQPQSPTFSPQDAQRNHIRTLLPNFLGALRVVQTPVDSADPQAAQLQQAARNWMANFKAGLSPQGHAMLDEIVGKMMRAKSEGRDWMEEMKNM
ncbi:hypothetical protein FB567DRAFT_609984 [Paraphoma chrysanthemicola]|uniref:Uncharacterized protein n=1 Tax=Paraphoma chrysanthemicola TaxID=798071 RepID=A0A8K0RIC0_9PLEO|nr:hypothetical protein FB567DRAFT_609984 [Paraphoma chrysanthemicola]